MTQDSHSRNRTTTSRFAHHRLDAYRVAVEMLAGIESLVTGFPRGHRDLREQLRRAAAAIVRHIAEGANRGHSGDKAARFLVAKGETGECDACLEMAEVLSLGPADVLSELRTQADRVAAMLTGLVRSERRRTESDG